MQDTRRESHTAKSPTGQHDKGKARGKIIMSIFVRYFYRKTKRGKRLEINSEEAFSTLAMTLHFLGQGDVGGSVECKEEGEERNNKAMW